jgi:hypothetical protein
MNCEHAQRVLDHMSRSNDNSAFAAALKEASRAGYQNAVDGLREMADHLSDENVAEVIRMLATALESMKP